MSANETARTDWNGASGQAWVADADRRDEVLAPALDALLAGAALRGGEGVLDVGCGCGATTLAAARAVGDDGDVVGVDISEPMLDVARRRAAAERIDTVRFRVGDAQTDELAQDRDVVLSRFGTMFFDDARAAFANIARTLRRGGRACIVTWQPFADNEWLAVTKAALSEFGDIPTAAPGAAGMFAQSSAAAIAAVLEPAGFTSIEVRPVHLDLPLGRDAAEATDYLTSVGMARAVLEPLGPDDRAAARRAVTDAVAARADAGGVRLAAGVLVTTATR